MPRLTAVLSFLSLAHCTLLAQAIQVSGGPTALWATVGLAPDGAVLVVAPGTYDPFDAWQRHLTIVAPQRASIQYTSSGGPSSTSLVGLSPSQPVRLIGFDVLPGTVWGPSGYAPGLLVARDVHIEDCTCEAISSAGFLSVDRTTVSTAGIALSANGGVVILTDSTFHGGVVMAPGGYPVCSPAIELFSAQLRAERVRAAGGSFVGLPFTNGGAAYQFASTGPGGTPCVATIADSVLLPNPPGAPGQSIVCSPGTVLTLTNTVVPGVTTCAVNTAVNLGTLRWRQRNWTPGGTSTLRLHEAPASLAIVVASFSLAPNPTPLVSELLFAGATPDWFVWTAGVNDVYGNLDFALTLPNVPAALYAGVWLHGLAGTGFPFHATTPLGGVIL